MRYQLCTRTHVSNVSKLHAQICDCLLFATVCLPRLRFMFVVGGERTSAQALQIRQPCLVGGSRYVC